MSTPIEFPNPTHSIFLTNVNGSGDDVMIFTSLDAETIRRAYTAAPVKTTWDELYEVPEANVGFYLFDTCWLTVAEEAQARKLAA